MSVIMEKDLHSILDTVYSVNCCQDEDTFMDVLMPSMIHMFHAECVTFHLIQGYPYHVKVIESRSFKSNEHKINEDKVNPELYKDGIYHHSPLLKEAISSSKVILKIGESISLKDWERSEHYNNFIAPQNLYWEMFMTLRWRNNLEGMITLWRSKEEGDYASGDVVKAQVLAPHLMLAARNVFSLEKVNKSKSNLITTEETNAEGLLLLNHKLKPLYFDARARQICLQINGKHQSDEFECEDGEFLIPNCIRQDCLNLLELQKLEEQPILWPKERIVIVQNNRKFRVECSFIWKPEMTSSQPSFLVTMSEIKVGQDLGLNFQARYQLSKREFDIIYYLNKGLSYTEIGEKLFISKLTVHTHVKNIYRKLGAKNRIEMYRYVQTPSWLK
jgi:DNA-binding CsgD family transcriptional regulator